MFPALRHQKLKTGSMVARAIQHLDSKSFNIVELNLLDTFGYPVEWYNIFVLDIFCTVSSGPTPPCSTAHSCVSATFNPTRAQPSAFFAVLGKMKTYSKIFNISQLGEQVQILPYDLG